MYIPIFLESSEHYLTFMDDLNYVIIFLCFNTSRMCSRPTQVWRTVGPCTECPKGLWFFKSPVCSLAFLSHFPVGLWGCHSCFLMYNC